MSLTQKNIVATDNTCTTSLLNLELHGNNVCVLIYIAKYRVEHFPHIQRTIREERTSGPVLAMSDR